MWGLQGILTGRAPLPARGMKILPVPLDLPRISAACHTSIPPMTPMVNVIGAGLAGSEAAFQLARRRIHVRLFEMRPERMTEAHQTSHFAELVCSNSLRNSSLETAIGVLKEEMRALGSVII